ncbi:hypothetical protein C5167_043963 [Papaver somniferum]|uniref:Uncharacterized protein n=1 Tax=Papaver somniferum TaxID=3469 RepID=A0A4Y7LAS7_PAPSO|nr:hypothetical protein C5167_043963 [Papaver somniferum]
MIIRGRLLTLRLMHLAQLFWSLLMLHSALLSGTKQRCTSTYYSAGEAYLFEIRDLETVPVNNLRNKSVSVLSVLGFHHGKGCSISSLTIPFHTECEFRHLASKHGIMLMSSGTNLMVKVVAEGHLRLAYTAGSVPRASFVDLEVSHCCT